MPKKKKKKEEEQNKRMYPLQEEKQILSLQPNTHKISFFSTFFFSIFYHPNQTNT